MTDNSTSTDGFKNELEAPVASKRQTHNTGKAVQNHEMDVQNLIKPYRCKMTDCAADDIITFNISTLTIF